MLVVEIFLRGSAKVKIDCVLAEGEHKECRENG